MFSRFRKCEKGNIAIFGCLLLPVLMLAGVGVEYSRISSNEKVLQSTLDYVPLDPHYAARYRVNAQKYLEGFLHANSGRETAQVRILLRRNKLRIEARDEIDTPLLGIIGQEKSVIVASVEMNVPGRRSKGGNRSKLKTH